ncbi:nuclear transport factor 2 family protein [Flavobacterium poyangense]|uniref:nuclear transport factor 2 family protein n=1 Tax=Flavobacterium poyangense TaxID=2204302 RepID=UPI001421ACC0|nr:nuclear transport factor 2 family protein [Flavobacterium sp. JXAS1]
MKTTKILCLTLTLFFSLVGHAQKDEKDLIKQTIETYFDGWMTGDTLKLGKVMHSSCNLKLIRDGQIVIITRKNYLSGFKPRPKMENTKGSILDINLTKNVASAKCEIETPKKVFTDYFNMIKQNGEWYIVDKISTNYDKK